MHTNDSEVSQKRYKYNGKERDTETGLDYYGARYYASWLCRFVSVDPQKDAYVFQNSFTYAANSPVTMVDVNGESPGETGGEEGGDDENILTSTLREASKLVEGWSPTSAYSFGLTAGIGEGVGEVLNFAYRLSLFGIVDDLASGDKTIHQEFIEGIGALAEAISTQEGRDALVGGIEKAVNEFFEDASFQNGAFDAGLAHGEVAFGIIITIATGGGGNAVKLLQALKKGPQAVAAVLKNSFKSSIKRADVDKKDYDNFGGDTADDFVRLSDDPLKFDNIVPEGKQANHIFSKNTGKLADTPENRELLEKFMNAGDNYLGKNEFGQEWFAKTLNDGTQLYGYSKGGIIKGAGINKVPRNLVSDKNLR